MKTPEQKTSQITYEELIAEIERIDHGQRDGATVTELVEQTDRSRLTILARLKAAASEGRLDVGRKQIRSIDGRPTWAPCYKVKGGKRP